ncbi:class I SAM-dependent methyltransferase [Paenibacillus sacheonensis]|uniref:Methyltransferase domain-containing protein n=1 Tax=Paenibacillus sacheonensis TaxID=742054 RepID=A0A7X4YS24_9BACL|nr:class I SAM-dependent methyltransferase [Paenibacillus sacheonensis]MBM7566894.1 SAM-dependent methyltransferase [Paenibacillus sacheonensis]NBC71516.1 methyltransferase domain-containing protein [Paenibacillus sacheonensis]
MGFLSVLGMAQRLVKERAAPGSVVIDATCGNGVDTQFLAELVGPRGTVYAFDIQEAALERTRARLLKSAGDPSAASAGAQLRLVHASHADMDKHVRAEDRGAIAAVMFNLGYLPGADADQTVITEPSSTLAALEASLRLLRPGGVIAAVLYPGHAGGAEEAEAVAAWAASLPQKAGQAMIYRMVQKPEAPFLIAIENRQDG